MPLLAGLLSGLFVAIAEFFAKWVTRKVAASAAAITVFAGLTTALFVLMGGIVSALVFALPSGSAIATGAWLFLPSNAAACAAACFGCDAAVAVYRMNVTNVQFAVYAP